MIPTENHRQKRWLRRTELRVCSTNYPLQRGMRATTRETGVSTWSLASMVNKLGDRSPVVKGFSYPWMEGISIILK